MGKKVYVPSRDDWHTASVAEWGEDDRDTCGGFGMLSTGRWEAPVICVYNFLPNGMARGLAVIVNGDLNNGVINVSDEDYPTNPIRPGKVSLVSMSYDAETVAHMPTEEGAVNQANEYQGGESDWIHDQYNDTVEGLISKYNEDEYFDAIYIGEFPCVDDDHITAQDYLVGKVREHFGDTE